MSISMQLKLNQVPEKAQNACQIAIRTMMEDVHTWSGPITPYKTGNLRTSVSKQMPTPLLGIIKWHAPYAEYQERGYTSGPIVNYTTPGTHAHFVEESVRRVMDRLPHYLRFGGLI